MLYVDSTGRLEGAMWWDGAANTITSTSVVDDGAWHEVVLSITSAGTETLSVDGAAQATTTLGADGNGPEPYATIGVGSGNSWPNIAGWTGFDGQIADVAFYGSALSQATIQNQYDAATQTAPVNTVPPAITGTPAVGDTLTASPGTWTGSSPISYAYQWQDCNTTGGSCSNIAGATSSSYTLADSDTGSTIRVAITAADSSGATSASSAQTTVVQALPPSNTALPSITGAPGAGETLVASPGSWSGTSPISYTYQWQDCNSSGGSCTNISAATSSTYTLASSDVNDTVIVLVTASNASLPGGGTATAASSPTAVVVAATSTTTYQYDSNGRLTQAVTSVGG